MTNINTYANTATRRAIEAAVGVGQTAVSNAVVNGKFPASWFNAMELAGLQPPRAFFAWKGVDQSVTSVVPGSLACVNQIGNAQAACQVIEKDSSGAAS